MAYLDEHQGAESDKSTSGGAQYQPSIEERKTIKMVQKLFDKHKKHREKYDHKWPDFYRLFRGRHWKEERPSYRHSAVFNLVFRVIQSQVPIMTDTRPKFEFLPQEANDRELSEILNQIGQSDWERNNWLMSLAEVLYEGAIYGTGYGYMPFDYESDDGRGGVVFESADPFYCFPDPEAHDINDRDRRSRGFIYAEPVDVGRLKNQYPDKAKFIKADLTDFIDGDKDEVMAVRLRSPVDNKTIYDSSESVSSADSKDKALKITLYLHDDQMTEEEVLKGKDESTGEDILEKKMTRKFKNCRKIVIVSNILLEDTELGYEDNKFPYARYVNYMLPREFFGVGEVEQIEGPQIIFNKIMSFVLDVLTLTGNPIWVIDTNSGVDTDNIFNRPGEIIEPNPGTRVQRVEGTQLQPYVINMLERVGELVNDISGNNDVSRGLKPEGITAARAIEALQESGLTRLRQKSRHLDAFLQDMGQLYLSRVFQFYTAPRVFRLTNNQSVEQYFKFHIEEQEQPDGEIQKVARYREMVEQDDGSMALGEEKVIPIQGRFDVKVSTGTSMAFMRAIKEQRSLNLFDRNIIDAEEVLKVVDWPNSEAVLQRMEERAAAMAQQNQGAPQ